MQLLAREVPNENREFMLVVRPLFDPDAPIFQEAFADLKHSAADLLSSAQIPAGWRQALKKGDRVDAVKEEKAQTERVEAWAPAVIGDPSTGTCTFLGAAAVYVSRGRFGRSKVGMRMAPSGTYTAGWEWREGLKPDDRLDIFDTQGHWFLGTVMKIREDGWEAGKDALVGYRVYMPEGTKKDGSGRRHEGWSEQYDEWIPVNSIRLQRFVHKV